MGKRTSKNPKSFRRAYREDYRRETPAPSIMEHAVETFKVILQNWKLFLPLLVIAVLLYIAFAGMMNEASYVKLQDAIDQMSRQVSGREIGGIAKAGALLMAAITSEGLMGGSSQLTLVVGALVFLIVWLTTIFFLRQRLAGQQIKVRDGLYNAMAPLLSTLVILAIVLAECVPIFFLMIVYVAAVKTGFLAMPFYALLFLGFAILMLTLSFYLLSSSLMALVAVSAPGLYPMEALKAATDLMRNRKMKLVLRILALMVVLIVLWAVVMLPIIGFDLWMKTFAWTAGIPLVPICLIVMICFTEIYVAAYLYLYYRWLLEAEP